MCRQGDRWWPGGEVQAKATVAVAPEDEAIEHRRQHDEQEAGDVRAEELELVVAGRLATTRSFFRGHQSAPDCLMYDRRWLYLPRTSSTQTSIADLQWPMTKP